MEELVKMSCDTCLNFFWLRNLPEHEANFCPYCGIKFNRLNDSVSPEERKLKPLRLRQYRSDR